MICKRFPRLTRRFSRFSLSDNDRINQSPTGSPTLPGAKPSVRPAVCMLPEAVQDVGADPEALGRPAAPTRLLLRRRTALTVAQASTPLHT